MRTHDIYLILRTVITTRNVHTDLQSTCHMLSMLTLTLYTVDTVYLPLWFNNHTHLHRVGLFG